MPRSLPPILAAALLGWLLAGPTPARADDSDALDRLEGTWEATKSRKKARAHTDASIEDVLAEMAFYKRPFARGQLREATEPCQTIQIDAVGQNKVRLACDDRPPSVSKRDGTPTRYVNDKGETFTLKQTVADDHIVQVFDGDSGTRVNVYRRNDAGRLIIDTTLTSGRLPTALKFSRTFERAD